MLRRSIWAPLVFGLLLSACATAPSQAPRASLPILQLSPRQFGGEVSLVQRLTVERLDGQATPAHTLDAMLEINAEHLRLAGFALGTRILTLNWDGHTLQETRHPLLPTLVDSHRVLRDIELVYWPATALRQALPTGWSLEESASERDLTQNKQRVVTIHYSAEPRWRGSAVLENLSEGYRLRIESQDQEPGQ